MLPSASPPATSWAYSYAVAAAFNTRSIAARLTPMESAMPREISGPASPLVVVARSNIPTSAAGGPPMGSSPSSCVAHDGSIHIQHSHCVRISPPSDIEITGSYSLTGNCNSMTKPANRTSLLLDHQENCVTPLMTIADVSKRLNCSDRHTRRLVDSGVLIPIRLGRVLRFDAEVIETWIRNGCAVPRRTHQ
jgi:excisionase family DNA binding protein